MNFLLDVNALVAWAWTDHIHHLRVDRWMAGVLSSRHDLATTTSICELGFVRVSVSRNPAAVDVSLAAKKLHQLMEFVGIKHRFLPDDLSSRRDFPTWCTSPKHTTDAHLLALAEKHGLQLATLDTGIPGAFVIPE